MKPICLHENNHKNIAARFILVRNIHWLLNWHWGSGDVSHYGNALSVSQKPQPWQKTSRCSKPWKWGLMDKVCWSFHQSTPRVQHTWVKELSCEARRPNSYQHRLTTRLCSLNFWWSRGLTGKHALPWFKQPLVGRALRLSKWADLHRTELHLSHSTKVMKCQKV